MSPIHIKRKQKNKRNAVNMLDVDERVEFRLRCNSLS